MVFAEIPINAIREALLNYKDRIEIYNSGTFPEGYDPQDFIDKVERPIRRNL